ncbi:MAG TPA: ATP-binding protein [Rhizomicrobium sp.]|nr:ATP-binding protein [Rhizomicrobium sp.]
MDEVAQATESERRAKLTLDQLALALRNLGPNHWFMPVFAAIICVMFSRWVAVPRLAAWFALLTLSVVPLGVVSHYFRRAQPLASEARIWIVRATLAYLTFACTWASMIVFLWVPGNQIAEMIIVMLLACTVAGNGALVGASRPLAVVVFAIYGSACIIAPLRGGGLMFNSIAALAFFFDLYLGYMSHQIYITARDMLRLRNDKTDLIAALASAKMDSDEARERAEAASRAKSEFLANMSHELRTPLNAILGFSELISSRTFEMKVEKHYEYASLINGSGHHLLSLINDVLDLAKIEAGGMALYDTDIDLGRMIEESMSMVAPRAIANDCSVHGEFADDLPVLVADERAVRQMLLNLLSNAVKFTPAGGTVTAFAHVDADGGLSFGVVDTGIGIAKEDQARVFQKFGQGRHDVAIMDKGTGLGLPIAKGLIEAHGGHMGLVSDIGVGTTVTVHFPASRTKAQQQRLSA